MNIEVIKSPEYKIRKIREIRNLSQEYLAQNLGLSVRAYSKIETGETQLTIRRLNQISKVLEVRPLDILGFDEKKLFNKNGVTTIPNGNSSQDRPIEIVEKRIRQLENELDFLRTAFQRSHLSVK